MNRLLILTKDDRRYARLLDRAGLADVEIRTAADAADARQAVRDCHILLAEPALAAAVLDAAEHLAWVQSTFAGVDALCREGLRRDYRLTGVKGIFGPLMSEYVFAYVLALERRLFEMRASQRQAAWVKAPYRPLGSLTMGICGLGSIGRHIAGTARHFGMRVLGHKRTPGDCPHVERVFAGSLTDDFLGELDYLVLALPRTGATDGFIDAAALSRMKPSAVLINVGRGNAVVEADLARALAGAALRAAVLDVFDREPLPRDSELWRLERAFISPHNAAVSIPEQVAAIFCENYRRFLLRKPLRYAIDFRKGY